MRKKHSLPFVFLIQITGWLVLIEVEARLYAQKPPLEQIRELILYANYPEAISQARLLLERNDLDARTRNQLLELLAIAQIADRDMQAARETLELLYRRDPGHVLSDPDASPPVIAAFAQAREAQKKPISVRLIHRPPRIQNREAIPIEVRFREGGDAVAEVRVAYRFEGESSWTQVIAAPHGDAFVARLPVVGPPDRSIRLEYAILALAPSGFVLVQSGTSEEPLVAEIPPLISENPNPTPMAPSAPPSSSGSILEEWWFWAIVGGITLAAGAGIITALVIDSISSGTLGTVEPMR